MSAGSPRTSSRSRSSLGLNTTVLVLNDALGTIADDPEFGKRLADAVMQTFGAVRGTPVYVLARSRGGGIHGNAATVIETHHADIKTVVVIGGNCGTVLGSVMGPRNDGSQESAVAILKDLAEQHGYVLHKKPSSSRQDLPELCICGHAWRTHSGARKDGAPQDRGEGTCVAKGCGCWHFDDERK